MQTWFAQGLLAALAAAGLMFSTAVFAADTGTASAGGDSTAQKVVGVVSIHDLSAPRTHMHSAPRAQFGRTPIRGHGDAFVQLSMRGARHASIHADTRFARHRTLNSR